MKKAMITLRFDPEQYNQVVENASAANHSLNEYCLRKLEVKPDSEITGKTRGRKPKPKSVLATEEACTP